MTDHDPQSTAGPQGFILPVEQAVIDARRYLAHGRPELAMSILDTAFNAIQGAKAPKRVIAPVADTFTDNAAVVRANQRQKHKCSQPMRCEVCAFPMPDCAAFDAMVEAYRRVETESTTAQKRADVWADTSRKADTRANKAEATVREQAERIAELTEERDDAVDLLEARTARIAELTEDVTYERAKNEKYEADDASPGILLARIAELTAENRDYLAQTVADAIEIGRLTAEKEWLRNRVSWKNAYAVAITRAETAEHERDDAPITDGLAIPPEAVLDLMDDNKRLNESLDATLDGMTQARRAGKLSAMVDALTTVIYAMRPEGPLDGSMSWREWAERKVQEAKA